MKIFEHFDIIILQEIHFGKRIKCPEGFLFIARLQTVVSKVPRGGVAVFKNMACHFEIETIWSELRDCVIIRVKSSNLIIAAPHIIPPNSVYYDDIYFSNLELIIRRFNSYHLIVTGDMNARVGTPRCGDLIFKYTKNLDVIVNSNGTKILDLINRWKDMIILNGLVYNDKVLDSQFTCYRGKLRSQNDLMLSNKLEEIKEFQIMEKYIYSDHCPIALTCTIEITPSLELVYKCSKDIFNYDHLDVNRRILPPLKLHRIDIKKAISSLEVSADKIKEEIGNDMYDNSTLSNLISNTIYNSCRSNYKTKEGQVLPDMTPNLINCNSKNFKAIAQANFSTFGIWNRRGMPEDECIVYLENWVKFENMAVEAENSKINVKRNRLWKNSKGDSKKLWAMIDWKGKAEQNTDDKIDEEETLQYFSGIFQSEKTKKHPVITNELFERLAEYNVNIPFIDTVPTMYDVELALRTFGKGVGIDGIPSFVITLFPNSLKELILMLMINVFSKDYPLEWSKQILHSIRKNGHTS